MRVTIAAHLEWAEDIREYSWWAESDGLRGFTAVYPSLGELQRETENAVAALYGDEGPVEVCWTTVGDVPGWAAVHISLVDERVVTQREPGNLTAVFYTTPDSERV